jgi:hypothetical protein
VLIFVRLLIPEGPARIILSTAEVLCDWRIFKEFYKSEKTPKSIIDTD